jgi:hypothetical protein
VSDTFEGDRIVTEYQYEFDGLVIGSGTDFVVEKVSGLLGSPAVRNTDTDKFNRHGATPGVPSYQKRTIGIDGAILGIAGEDIEEKILLANATFQLPRRRFRVPNKKFVFYRPGQVKKFVWARAERRDIDSEFLTARGLAKFSIDMVAPDPLIYSLDEHVVELTLDVGETNGQIEVWQRGDLADGAEPIIEIDGPATDAIITSATDDNREIKLEGDIDVAETFTLDTGLLEADLDGADAFSMVRNDSQYWALLPGRNIISYQRTGSAAISRLRIRWRDTWQ